MSEFLLQETPITDRVAIYSHGSSEMLNAFSNVCDWFESIGFKYARTRYGDYRRILEDHQRFQRGRDFAEVKAEFDDAFLEVTMITRIHGDIASMPPEQFYNQLKKVTTGRAKRFDGKPDESRNFLFELSTAARFIRAGFQVDISGICDIVVDIGSSKTLFVECKRLSSFNRIEKALKEARKQIHTRISQKIDKRHLYGLIATNIDELHNYRPDKVFRNVPAITSFHIGENRKVILDHKDSFFSARHPKVIGVLVESNRSEYVDEADDEKSFAASRHSTMLHYMRSDSETYKLFTGILPKLGNQDYIKSSV